MVTSKVFQKDAGGFTLIELMIVIAIIGILASIAVPQFSSYRIRAYNAAARSDAKNAYTSAQTFFCDSPNGTVDLAALVAYGYQSTANVTVTVVNGTPAGLTMTSVHGAGTTTYTVDTAGAITP